MIPKKVTNSNDPKDYRPISLASNIAKVAEKMIAFKLKEFMKKKKLILNNNQVSETIDKQRTTYVSWHRKENFNKEKKLVEFFSILQRLLQSVAQRATFQVN